jgi:hypothetical protein
VTAALNEVAVIDDLMAHHGPIGHYDPYPAVFVHGSNPWRVITTANHAVFAASDLSFQTPLE